MVASGNTVEAVKIFAETGVGSDIIEAIQTYCRERIDLDDETIEGVDDLALWQLLSAIGYLERISVCREALQN